MRISFFVSFIIIVLLRNFAYAQKKIISNVDSLVQNQKFALIVTNIERKAGFNGNNGSSEGYPYYNFPNTYNFYSVAASLALTSKEPSTPGYWYTEQYYNRSLSNFGTVEPSANITREHESHLDSVTSAIYIVQDRNFLMVKNNSNDLNALKHNNFSILSDNEYQLDILKKNKEKWNLTYTLYNDGIKKKLYLTITTQGDFKLKGEPTNTATYYMYGYIVDPQKFVKTLSRKNLLEN